MNRSELDYRAGIEACMAGDPCYSEHPDFVAGYGKQYAQEQMMSALSRERMAKKKAEASAFIEDFNRERGE